MTMEDTEKLDGNGFPKQKYTVHILPPMYPDPNKTARTNEHFMMQENYRLCCEVYERVYGEKVTY